MAVSGHLCQRGPGCTHLGIRKGPWSPLGWWEGGHTRQPDIGFSRPPLVTKPSDPRGWPVSLALPASHIPPAPSGLPSTQNTLTVLSGLGWTSCPSHLHCTSTSSLWELHGNRDKGTGYVRGFSGEEVRVKLGFPWWTGVCLGGFPWRAEAAHARDDGSPHSRSQSRPTAGDLGTLEGQVSYRGGRGSCRA